MPIYNNPHGDQFFYKTGNGFADLFNSAVRGILNNKDTIVSVTKNSTDIASNAQKIINNKHDLAEAKIKKDPPPKKVDPKIVDGVVLERKGKGIYDIN